MLGLLGGDGASEEQPLQRTSADVARDIELDRHGRILARTGY